MSMHEVEHLTIAEATTHFGIGRTKLYELLNAGEIEAVKLGRRTLLKKESLRAFIAKLPVYGEQHQ